MRGQNERKTYRRQALEPTFVGLSVVKRLQGLVLTAFVTRSQSRDIAEMRRDGKHNFYRLLPRRFEEMLGMIFATVPGEGQQIRFDDFVLTYTQNSVSQRIVQPPPRAL